MRYLRGRLAGVFLLVALGGCVGGVNEGNVLAVLIGVGALTVAAVLLFA